LCPLSTSIIFKSIKFKDLWDVPGASREPEKRDLIVNYIWLLYWALAADTLIWLTYNIPMAVLSLERNLEAAEAIIAGLCLVGFTRH
jgi:hypothetical protein